MCPGQGLKNQLLFSLQWPVLGSLTSASLFFPVTQARFLQSLLLLFSLQLLMLFSFTCYSCLWKISSLFLFWLILSVNLKRWFLKFLGNVEHRTVLVVLLWGICQQCRKRANYDLVSKGRLSLACGSYGPRILILNWVNYMHLACDNWGETVGRGLGQGRVEKQKGRYFAGWTNSMKKICGKML